MRAFRAAGALAVQQVRDSAVSVEGASEEETKDLLRKCAATTLNSKLVRLRPCMDTLVIVVLVLGGGPTSRIAPCLGRGVYCVLIPTHIAGSGLY